jgi:parvulin-like peptidyl-prolyl isomerase
MELSVHHDAKKGGTVENLTEQAVKTTYGREFLQALQEATEGELIGPYKTRNDFYEVAKFHSKREERIKSFEEVKDKLRKLLIYRAQNEAIQEQVNALKEKTNVEILFDPTAHVQQQTERD